MALKAKKASYLSLQEVLPVRYHYIWALNELRLLYCSRVRTHVYFLNLGRRYTSW